MKPFYNFDIEQRSPEWHEAKLGKFSGSDFHVMLGNSEAKTNFLWNKIAELRYQDTEQDEYTTYAMERGIILEPEARRVYSAVSEVEVREVGLVEARDEFDGWAVCSPDGLVGEDGIIEIKCCPQDTEVLTTRGFVKIQNLTKDSIICESDENGNLYWRKPRLLIKKPYKGELVNFYRNGQIALQTTPEHRLLCCSTDRTKKSAFITEAKNFLPSYAMFYGGAVPGGKSITAMQRLYIAIKADGPKNASKDEIVFNFSKRRQIERLPSMFAQARLSVRHGTTRHFSNPKWKSSKYFYIKDQNVSAVKEKSYNDLFPLDKLSTKQALEILEEASLWDGTVGSSNAIAITSTNKEDIDFFVAVSVIANKPAKVIDVKHSGIHTAYMVSISRFGEKSRNSVPALRYRNRKQLPPTTPHNGYVYCITTTAGFFVSRTGNNVPVVIGNCIAGKFFEQYTRKGEKKYGYIKPEYRTQVQFNLFVTQRAWADFIYYHPRGGIFIQRVFPDAEYIEKIKTALREGIQFIKERI